MSLWGLSFGFGVDLVGLYRVFEGFVGFCLVLFLNRIFDSVFLVFGSVEFFRVYILECREHLGIGFEVSAANLLRSCIVSFYKTS